MENIISEILAKVDGYLLSIERNYEEGCYEIRAGIKKDWEFKANKIIDYETENENDHGMIVRIFGKHTDVTLDELIDYLSKIITVNMRIEKMEEEFKERFENEKKRLQDEYIELKKNQEKTKGKILEYFEEDDEDVDNDKHKEEPEELEEVTTEEDGK